MKTGSKGFSLVEIIVVIGIFSVLLAIGTLQTSGWLEKGAVESQTMFIYGELMGVRQSAMNFKRPRTVVMKRDSFQIYSTAAVATAILPISNNKLRYPLMSGDSIVKTTGEKIRFDERGFTSDALSLCTEPTGELVELNSGAYDSVVVSGLRIKVGKRTVEGAWCVADDIQLK